MKQTIYNGHIWNVGTRLNNLILLSRVTSRHKDGCSYHDIWIPYTELGPVI